MLARTFLIAFVALLPLSACSKKPSCPAGSYENKDPAFCLPIPAGMKADAPQGGGTSGMSMRIAGDMPGGYGMYVVYWGDNDAHSLDERAKIVDNMASDSLKLLDKGDVPNGKWWRFRTGQNNIFATVLVKGSKGIIRCEIQNTAEATAAKLLDSCKALQAS